MGIMDKIESTMGGHKDKKAEQQAMKEGSSYENQSGSHSLGRENEHGPHGSYNDTSSSAMPGSYDTGSSGLTGSQGTGSGLTSSHGHGTTGSKLQNPISSSTGTHGSMADDYDRRGGAGYGSSTGSGAPSNYPANDGYGSEKMRPNEPMDPYSSKGQQAAAAAGTGGAGYGTTSNRDYAGRDDDVSRSRQGGILNSGDREREHEHGHGGHHHEHSSKENCDAIPTAGGEKLGGLGGSSRDERYGNEGSLPGQSRTTGQSDHHYGRDAALAGGAGAGAYELGKDRHHDQGRGHHEGSGLTGSRRDEPYGSNSTGAGGYSSTGGSGSNYPQGTLDSRNPQDVSYLGGATSEGRHGDQGGHHYGRDAALAGGAGAGAYELGKDRDGHHGRHGQHGTEGTNFRQEMSDGRSRGNETGLESRMAGTGLGGAGATGGMSIEKKLASAYEAGYRDAMAHAQADREYHSSSNRAADRYDDNTTGATHAGKPSMMDKLNPKKDADGDGKAGFMK